MNVRNYPTLHLHTNLGKGTVYSVLIYISVTAGSLVTSTTRTTTWVWNGPYPAVKYMSFVRFNYFLKWQSTDINRQSVYQARSYFKVQEIKQWRVYKFLRYWAVKRFMKQVESFRMKWRIPECCKMLEYSK